ncbi:hypothetical protein AB0B28_06445 [Glycomyces sp. NPDC046736]|uniref:hypothetical protein n=1 Tax=Glycomyces sp. NPDC046736 TaxID=3155615 RepID=UPI0034066195
MATKTQQAMEQVGTLLHEQPGFHDLEAITTATGLSPQMAGRVLATLVDSGAVAVDDSEGVDRWCWTQHLESETGQANDKDTATEAEGNGENVAPEEEADTTVPASSDATAAVRDGEDHWAESAADEAESAEGVPDQEPEFNSDAVVDRLESDPGEAGGRAGDDQGAAETDGGGKAEDSEREPADGAGVTIQTVLLEYDPMIMLMARVLAEATEPLTTRQVAEAAYMPMGTREVLTALRALNACELVDCSKPFAPDEEDCTWQRRGELVSEEFMSQARGVSMSAAPDRVVCPTCRHVRPIAGVSRPRKRNSDLRADGSRRLPPGALKKFAEEWLRRPENAGEVVSVGQLKRELRQEHGNQISETSYGALRQLLEEQFSKPDPTDATERPLVVLEEGVSPISFRIRDLA